MRDIELEAPEIDDEAAGAVEDDEAGVDARVGGLLADASLSEFAGKAAGAAEDDEAAVDTGVGAGSLADSTDVEGDMAGAAEDEVAVGAGVAGTHEDNKAGESECILDVAGVFSGSESLSESETCALDFFCFFFPISFSFDAEFLDCGCFLP